MAQALSICINPLLRIVLVFALMMGFINASLANTSDNEKFQQILPAIMLLLSCEMDADKDGLCDENEDQCIDQDHDLICMRDEILHGLDPNDASDALLDNDEDGLNNLQEITHGLDPNDPDDAALDADEDGLSNLEEITQALTDPNDADSDDDGVEDKVELAFGMNPLLAGDDLGGINAEDKYRMHVMNRLSYGPSARLDAEIKAVGIEQWIVDQLQPELMPEKGSFTQAEHPAQFARDNMYIGHLYQSESMAGIRPLESKKQLQTVMGKFWDNHFSTYQDSHLWGSRELFEEDAFYENALGNFRALLGLSAKSYTMSIYLNGDKNVKYAPNENYAREVMELHTLGLNGGYEAQDIVELARVLTGWRYKTDEKTSRYDIHFRGLVNSSHMKLATFNFYASDHDDGTADWDNDDFIDGDKILLGHTIQSRIGENGVLEGEEALDILAEHSSTAKFICSKLAQKFISDKPLTSTILQCADTFIAHNARDNQIAVVLQFLFDSVEFNDVNKYGKKAKDIQDYLFGLGRLLNWDGQRGHIDTQASRPCNVQRTIGCRAFDVGQGFFKQPPPTGWPEQADAWTTTANVFDTFVQANEMIFGGDATDLIDFFNEKDLTLAPEIIRFLFYYMLSGDYGAAEINMAYAILFPEHALFSIDDSENAELKLRELVSQLAASAEYHLQ